MQRILIVEDEPDIQDMLVAYLQNVGYETAIAGDGVEALSLFRKEQFDLILLDLMIPKIDGFGVCELIRKESDVPIVMLTAMSGEEDQLKGFGMNIDDYVTKPFSIPVLLQKIRVVLRRSMGDGYRGTCIHYRDISLYPDDREVKSNGILLDLTTKEFELLQTFITNPGRVYTREVLLAKIWDYDFYGDERVVDTHVKNLRHKLGNDYIETVRGVGYRVAKEDS
ncbi:MAG: response regulator transcription factor [Lachnospiraceae bacterium]|nr:response regulator transcription factor [Lachnospiraceae bacterium]